MRIIKGAPCYGKAQVGGYGHVVSKKVATTVAEGLESLIRDALLRHVGIDLRCPDSQVQDGDTVLLPGGDSEELVAGEDRYAKLLEDLRETASFKTDAKEAEVTARLQTVVDRWASVCSAIETHFRGKPPAPKKGEEESKEERFEAWVSDDLIEPMAHCAEKVLGWSDGADADYDLDAAVERVGERLKILAAVQESFPDDTHALAQEVRARVGALSDVQALLGTASYAGVVEKVRALFRLRSVVCGELGIVENETSDEDIRDTLHALRAGLGGFEGLRADLEKIIQVKNSDTLQDRARELVTKEAAMVPLQERVHDQATLLAEVRTIVGAEEENLVQRLREKVQQERDLRELVAALVQRLTRSREVSPESVQRALEVLGEEPEF